MARNKLVGLFIVALSALPAAGDEKKAAPEIKAGDRVVVVKETALDSDGRTIKQLDPGEWLVVEEVKDGFLGVTSGRQGWVNQADVAAEEKALESLKPALEKDPDNVRLREACAYLAYIEEKWDTAIDHYSALVRLEPDRIKHRMDRAYVYRQKGDKDSAMTDVDAAAAIAPQDWRIVAVRAALWRDKKEPDKAIADYDLVLKAVTQPRARARLLSERAGCHRDRRELQKALEDLDEALKLTWRDGQIFAERAGVLLGLRRYEEAANGYSTAIFIEGGSAWLYTGRGESNRLARKLKEAEADFDYAVKLDPEYEHAYMYRSILYADQGKSDKALADLAEVVRLRPSVATYCTRGRLYVKLGEFDKAESDIEQSMKLDAKSPLPWYAQGLLRQKQNKLSEARTAFQTARDLEPEDSSLNNDLAWFLATCTDASVRDGAMAVKFAKLSCELSEFKNPASLDTLAAAYAEVGDFEHAVEFQKKAIEAAPKDDKDEPGYAKRLALYQEGKPYRDEGSEDTKPDKK